MASRQSVYARRTRASVCAQAWIHRTCPNVELSEFSISNVTTNSVSVTIAQVTGASFYFWRYKKSSDTNWNYPGGAQASNIIALTSLDAGTNYDFQALRWCSGWTDWCSTFIFTTGSNGNLNPDCTHNDNVLISTTNASYTSKIITNGNWIKTQNLAAGTTTISADTEWRATECVEIAPDFKVNLGSELNISTGGCNSN